ncbi:hypothetical protein B6259_00775 [Ruminococcaceae bacterium CPB6]|nr:hypothetical protein B6259_00775 [Ruminococcaceae bacterium CPB6]
MATITKRGKSYLISTSCGYDSAGKQIRKTMTWKPESSMTVRQEKKAVKAAAVRFEDRVQSGQYIDSTITLSQFIDQWLSDYAEVSLRADTIAGYKANIPTIKAALRGITKLQARKSSFSLLTLILLIKIGIPKIKHKSEPVSNGE